MRRAEPSFAQACRRAVGLEVSGVNHQRAIKGRLVCQLGEEPAENTESAPSDEPIVQRLVRAIFRRSILPLKFMFDNVKNAADDAPVIDTGDTVRAGEERTDPFHLAFGKIKQGTHVTPPCLQHTLFSFHWE